MLQASGLYSKHGFGASSKVLDAKKMLHTTEHQIGRARSVRFGFAVFEEPLRDFFVRVDPTWMTLTMRALAFTVHCSSGGTTLYLIEVSTEGAVKGPKTLRATSG